MTSIRIFLTASVIAIVILANFLAAVKGYQSSMQRSDEIFDSKMLHVAKLITSLFSENSQIQIDHSKNLPSKKFQPHSLNDSNLIYTIQNQHGNILAQSDFLDNKSFPMHELNQATARKEALYDWVNFSGYRWRQLKYFDEKSDLRVVLMEKQSDRFLLAETVVLESIYPILFAIPSIALIIFFIIGKGLNPLKTLSKELMTKKANNLSPIQIPTLPKELGQLTGNLNHLLERLDGAIHREKRFSADAAHELRTPITALGLQMTNLLNDIDLANRPSVEKEGITIIKLTDSIFDLNLGIQRMSHLVEQILTLNQFSVDDYCENFRPVNLIKVLRQTIAEVYPLIEDKQQSIELLIETKDFASINNQINEIEENYMVDGDYHGLICLFSNIIENANKYTPKGGSIRMIVSQKSNILIISLLDSGPGISEKEKERIFDRFYRVGGDSHQSNVPGCGLGLSIVKEIALRHGAIIDLYSKKQVLDKHQIHLINACSINFEIGLWFNVIFSKDKINGKNETE
ncbi:MAG: hypothetical protein COB38_11130 [Gammaproteobacteria bacterium]|nr:MAG: hypothetical protein COB38_11130 [Gammaproteobacteria bacterium]